MNNAYIVDAVRTAGGRRNGRLSKHHPADLGGIVIDRLLERTGVAIGDVDLYEVNEAFGSVPLAWAAAIGADTARLNPNGGAQALGHPLGATGTKLMATLINELRRRGGRYGLLAICEGLGTANATLIEAC